VINGITGSGLAISPQNRLDPRCPTEPVGYAQTNPSRSVHPVTTRTQMLHVRPMRRTDVRRASELHLQALPCGFFPRLGKGFLAAYHASFVDSPHGIALVAEVDGAVAGVLVGTARNAAHYRWVVRHRAVRLAWCALVALASRPRVAAEFLRSRLGRYLRAVLRFARRAKPAQPAGQGQADQGPVAVLTHVAVDDTYRGAGLGGRLVERFLHEAQGGPADRALLVTLDGEDGAGAFWQAQGWEAWGRHDNADGHSVLRFRRSLR
jgi:GNAT superfamily N-acetyltransferase